MNQTSKKLLKVGVLWHYSKDDEDCGGEYLSIDVYIDRKKVATFGDYYHNKGDSQVEGFIKALNVMGHPVSRKDKSVADGEY